MSEETRIEVILKNGHFVRRQITDQSLGTQDAFLAQLIDNTPSTPSLLANIKVKRGHLPEAVFPICMSSSRSELTLCTEIKELPFVSTFERMADNRYAPTYGSEPLPGIPFLRDPFPVSLLGGRVIFALVFTKTEGTPPWAPAKCYMGLKLNTDNEVRHFNYPNHFVDGRVCMGRDWDSNQWPRLPNGSPNYASSIIGVFRAALESFHETRVNSDLATRYTPIIFAKDIDGKWTIDNTNGAPDNSFTIISNRVLNSIIPSAFEVIPNNATGNTD